mgnify:CR=1 FL=1
MEENLESIEGYVDHIIYRNADNGYTVLVLVCNEEEETCVGVFSDIAEGENIKAKGSYTEHPTYGRQFQVKSFEEKAPQDEVAIERYLGSGAIKGIGIALARVYHHREARRGRGRNRFRSWLARRVCGRALLLNEQQHHSAA